MVTGQYSIRLVFNQCHNEVDHFSLLRSDTTCSLLRMILYTLLILASNCIWTPIGIKVSEFYRMEERQAI